MLRSSREGPTEEKTGRHMPIRLGTALIAATGLLLGPLALATSASAATHSHATAADPGTYVPVTPFRITDTRTGSGLPNAGSTLTTAAPTLTVQVTGVGTTPVPAGSLAAVLNVTATNTKSSGFLTVFEAGTTQPTVSNLNFDAGQTVANLVTAPLSAAGAVSIYSSATDADVVVDVEGYFTSTPAANGYGLFNSMSPVRDLGTLALGAAVAANTSVPVTVAGGTTTVPANASAVLVNATVAHDSAATFLSLYPAPAVTTEPTFSNLNASAGEVVANRAIVAVGTGGVIEVYNHAGSADVDIDVDGYFTGVGGTGSDYVPLAAPVRVADTRTASLIGTETPITTNASESFLLATTASGIPTTATSVDANVTVVAGASSGYLSVYPAPAMTTQPDFSDVNWVANGIVPNFTIADTNGTGSVEVYNSYGTINLVVDVFGYFATYVTSGPVMASAVVTDTSIAITYNQAVNCAALDAADFTYYYSGAASGGLVASGSCSGDVLTLLPVTSFLLPVGVGTIEYIAVGAAGDNVQNSSATAALTPQALSVASTVGLTMESAQVLAGGELAITYNEDVSCQAGPDGTAFSDFTYYSAAGILGGAIANCEQQGSDVLWLIPNTTFQDPGSGAEILYTAPTTPVATAATSPFGNAAYATGSTSVFAPTQTLTTFETPAMTTAIVTPGASGVGTIAVTYNEAPICPSTAAGIQAAWVYSNDGTPAYPTHCGVAGDVLTLSLFLAGGTTGTTAVTLVTPVSTDTLVYTEPTTDGGGVSVSTAVGFPEYAATQTLPYADLTGVPSMVSAVVTTGVSIAITYNEPVFCPSTGADVSDFIYEYTAGFSGGAPTSGDCTTSGDVLTLLGPFNAPQGSASIEFDQGAAETTANAVYAVNSASADVFAADPQTIAGSPSPIS